MTCICHVLFHVFDGLLSVPQLWRNTHELFQRTPSQHHLAEVNDYLVDFLKPVAKSQFFEFFGTWIRIQRATYVRHHLLESTGQY